ncbi:MAG TPA: cell division FtsA domain-containing protein [Bacilli bacterium]|nr:cell division FtsA domain-containing protein [Bacilli bacterium]
MDKTINTLEIGHNGVKLVIGYQIEHKPVVLYANTFHYEKSVENGEIVEPIVVANAIKALLKNVAETLNIIVEDVVLALPAIDLEIFVGRQQTSVLAAKVDKVDVTNVTTLLRKSKIDAQKQIVSIVPINFSLESGKSFYSAPIGEPSTLLSLDAYLHLLPLWIYNSYINVVENAGIKVLKTFAETYALGELYNRQKDVATNYVLIDFGAERTSVSLIAQNRLFFSKSFKLGSYHLTAHISQKLNISLEKAEELKRIYGFDTSPIKTKFAIAKRDDEVGTKISTNQLNEVINEFLLIHQRNLDDTLAIMAKVQQINALKDYQMIITGGGTKLHGYQTFLAREGHGYNYIFAQANIIGARNPEYATCLGLIKAYTRYAMEIGDEQTPVGPLSRK